MGPQSKSLLDAALYYREKMGFSVIPVRSHLKGKEPYVKTWKQYQEAPPSEDQIKQWWSKWPNAGIGIVTGKVSGLSVLDVDSDEGIKVLDETLPDSFLTPIAHSPRGYFHFYLQYDPAIPTKSNAFPGCDTRSDGGYIIAPPSPGWNGKPYRWKDGCRITDLQLAPLPDNVLDMIVFNAGAQHNVSNLSTLSTKVLKESRETSSTSRESRRVCLIEGHRDESLFHVAHCLVKGGMEKADVEYVLDILSKKCDPPFSEKETTRKIQSAIERAQRKERNLSQEVREWVLSSNDQFLSREVRECLGMSSREDQKILSWVLRQLCDEGIIERCGNRNGCFRRIDAECEEIDWRNANLEEYPVILPFGLHDMVEIHERNIIVVAGEQNAGKTAFLLNVAKENMDKHDIWYFSSEMGAKEFRKRLMLFKEIPFPDGWKMNVRERGSNFADVIRPDALNIVDYLEVHEDFWRVGAMLKAIYDKLRKGIAVVAVQKDPRKDFGRGASMGLEKPRLYLTISADPPAGNTIKILKAKNYRNSQDNPNGKLLDFKLVQGSSFMPVIHWRHVKK